MFSSLYFLGFANPSKEGNVIDSIYRLAGFGLFIYYRLNFCVFFVGPMAFHDRGKWTEFTELSTVKRN